MTIRKPIILRDYPDKRDNIKRLAKFYNERCEAYAKKNGYTGSLGVPSLRKALLEQHRNELTGKFHESIVESMLATIEKDLPLFDEEKTLKSVCGGNVALFNDLRGYINTPDSKKEEYLLLLSQDKIPNTEVSIAAIKLIQQYNRLAPCLPFMPIKNLDETDMGLITQISSHLEGNLVRF